MITIAALAAPVSAQETTPATQRRAFEVFGEHYPTTNEEQSVYAGFRLVAPVSPRFALVVDGGYVAAGWQAGRGDDGLALGAGLEMRLKDGDRSVPFLRGKVDRVVKQTADNGYGDLQEVSYMVSGGVRFSPAIEAHVNYGRNYSGDMSFGIGLALGLRL